MSILSKRHCILFLKRDEDKAFDLFEDLVDETREDDMVIRVVKYKDSRIAQFKDGSTLEAHDVESMIRGKRFDYIYIVGYEKMDLKEKESVKDVAYPMLTRHPVLQFVVDEWPYSFWPIHD